MNRAHFILASWDDDQKEKDTWGIDLLGPAGVLEAWTTHEAHTFDWHHIYRKGSMFYKELIELLEDRGLESAALQKRLERAIVSDPVQGIRDSCKFFPRSVTIPIQRTRTISQVIDASTSVSNCGVQAVSARSIEGIRNLFSCDDFRLAPYIWSLLCDTMVFKSP